MEVSVSLKLTLSFTSDLSEPVRVLRLIIQQFLIKVIISERRKSIRIIIQSGFHPANIFLLFNDTLNLFSLRKCVYVSPFDPIVTSLIECWWLVLTSLIRLELLLMQSFYS
jgi:hypothetical protein